jgi:hypothetical protein
LTAKQGAYLHDRHVCNPRAVAARHLYLPSRTEGLLGTTSGFVHCGGISQSYVVHVGDRLRCDTEDGPRLLVCGQVHTE